MANIQVDMFEVQLGAALLLQFRLANGDIVRVLADAGVDKASGYPPEHVYSKLFNSDGSATNVWSAFSNAAPKLDLIIGTHYDADHLRGLIPIIENNSLIIDEIWLPPVQDDDGVVSTASASGGESNLVKRLMTSDSSEVLKRYLTGRLVRIEDVNKIYDTGLKQADRQNGGNLLNHLVEKNRSRQYQKEALHQEILANAQGALEYFEQQRLLASQALGEDDCTHAHEYLEDNNQQFIDAVDSLKHGWTWIASPFDRIGRVEHDMLAMDSLPRRWQNEQVLKADHLALETIRKSAADEAINATNLANVVESIKRRHSTGGSNIRVVSEGIPQGRPRYFRWHANRFQEANPSAAKELGFHLMGPSYELIAKLHEKLPIGTYLLAYRAQDLRSGTITPSNQLSYVMRFHLQDQAILVAGDAGFTDFAPARTTKFYPDLLALLKPLHVVQVAHHGGMNHRFYQALVAANLPGQLDWSFLLLSHAVNDTTRPRAEFSRFVSLFRHDNRDDVSILFTSQPTQDKVDAILDLIHPIVPNSVTPSDRGDIRLSFPHDKDMKRGGTLWRVQKHNIRVV